MKKFILPSLLVPLISSPAYASIDVFGDTIKEHGMLLLLIGSLIVVSGNWFYQRLVSNLEQKIKDAKELAEKREEEAEEVGMRLHQRELDTVRTAQNALLDRLNKVETEQVNCQRNLTMQFVTRTEYDRFQAQHREDVNALATRMESMIKDFKNELKEDMQDQIDRIITVINEVIKQNK